MGKPSRNKVPEKAKPKPKNSHAGKCLGYLARLSFPPWRREGESVSLLGFPLANRLPHHGSTPKEEGREQNGI